MNQDGNIIHAPDLDEISNFGEGLFIILNKKKYGFMDTNGNIVIPCQYDAADYFKEGKAFVTTNKGKKDEKKFYIDKSGKVIE